MPIVFAGFVDALARLGAAGHPQSASIRRTAVATSLAATAALLPDYPLWALTRASTWHTSPRIAAARQILAEIPDGVNVADANALAAQLTDRDTVSLFDPPAAAARPAWVVAPAERVGYRRYSFAVSRARSRTPATRRARPRSSAPRSTPESACSTPRPPVPCRAPRDRPRLAPRSDEGLNAMAIDTGAPSRISPTGTAPRTASARHRRTLRRLPVRLVLALWSHPTDRP